MSLSRPFSVFSDSAEPLPRRLAITTLCLFVMLDSRNQRRIVFSPTSMLSSTTLPVTF